MRYADASPDVRGAALPYLGMGNCGRRIPAASGPFRVRLAAGADGKADAAQKAGAACRRDDAGVADLFHDACCDVRHRAVQLDLLSAVHYHVLRHDTSFFLSMAGMGGVAGFLSGDSILLLLWIVYAAGALQIGPPQKE